MKKRVRDQRWRVEVIDGARGKWANVWDRVYPEKSANLPALTAGDCRALAKALDAAADSMDGGTAQAADDVLAGRRSIRDVLDQFGPA